MDACTVGVLPMGWVNGLPDPGNPKRHGQGMRCQGPMANAQARALAIHGMGPLQTSQHMG